MRNGPAWLSPFTSLRLARLTQHKSTPELVALADHHGDDGVMELVAAIGRTTNWFKSLHEQHLAAESTILTAFAWRRLIAKLVRAFQNIAIFVG